VIVVKRQFSKFFSYIMTRTS